MAMLIKGDEIDALVAKYCAMTGVKNKSEAVRKALAAQIEALAAEERLVDRVGRIQRRAAEAGFVSTGEDLKPFFDEQWGERHGLHRANAGLCDPGCAGCLRGADPRSGGRRSGADRGGGHGRAAGTRSRQGFCRDRRAGSARFPALGSEDRLYVRLAGGSIATIAPVVHPEPAEIGRMQPGKPQHDRKIGIDDRAGFVETRMD